MNGTGVVGNPRRMKHWQHQLLVWTTRGALLIAALAYAERQAGRSSASAGLFLPPPSQVWDVLTTWERIDIGGATRSTLVAFLMGYIGGFIAGLVLAICVWLARRSLVGAWLESLVALLHNIPRIVMIPLFILWFGLIAANAALFGAVSVSFVIFYHVLAGFRAAPQRLMDGVAILGGSRRELIQLVVLPSARPIIFTGALIAVPQALVSVIAAEMLVGSGGLGGLVQTLGGQYNGAGVFAVAVVACLLGIAVNAIVRLIARLAGLERLGRGMAAIG